MCFNDSNPFCGLLAPQFLYLGLPLASQMLLAPLNISWYERAGRVGKNTALHFCLGHSLSNGVLLD